MKKYILLMIIIVLALILIPSCAEKESNGAETPTPIPTITSTPTKTIEVKFTMSDFSIEPEKVKAGESVAISFKVTNTSDAAGVYRAILKINGVEKQKKEVTVEPRKTRSISFLPVTEDKAGDYNVQIGNETVATGSFTVE